MKSTLSFLFVAIAFANAARDQRGLRGLRDSAFDGDERQLEFDDHERPHYPTYQVVPTRAPIYEPTTTSDIYKKMAYEQPAAFVPTYQHPSLFVEDTFREECIDELLSKRSTGDGLISQHDFAEFLTNYCIWQGVCEKKESLKFQMLPTPVQLAFVGPLCSDGTFCQVEAESEFGYVYDKDTEAETHEQIVEICTSLYSLVGDYTAPTPATPNAPHPRPTCSDPSPHLAPIAPTSSPTKSPIRSPTKAPTNPTKAPTNPTKAPVTPAPQKTDSLTRVPETTPIVPTIAPILSSGSPVTRAPTETPVVTTDSPVTVAPSVAPTNAPTDMPSLAPPVTNAPLAAPIVAPCLPSSDMPGSLAPAWNTDSPTANPSSSVPISGNPVANSPNISPSLPTTETPVTVAPASNTDAPITIFPSVSAPISRAPVTNTPNVAPTLPTSERPITLAPILDTNAPMTLPPVAVPVSPAPSTTIPSSSPVTANPIDTTSAPTGTPSQFPSMIPSFAPASVFINEIGKTNGIDFVEVAYSDFIGGRINEFGIYAYGRDGAVLDSESLTQGVFASNGLVFTFTTHEVDGSVAFALVNDLAMETRSFFSIGLVITAVDGPAAGMNSTDITVRPFDGFGLDRNESRLLQGAEDASNLSTNSSISLGGSGCEFDDFVFENQTSTPGAPNVNQTILGCSHVPTEAPSSPPVNQGIITPGSIVGFISGGLAILLVAYLCLGQCKMKDDEPEQAVTPAGASKSIYDPKQPQELMVDTMELRAETGDEGVKTPDEWSPQSATQNWAANFEVADDSDVMVASAAAAGGSATGTVASRSKSKHGSWFGSLLKRTSRKMSGADRHDTSLDTGIADEVGDTPVTPTADTDRKASSSPIDSVDAALIALYRRHDDDSSLDDGTNSEGETTKKAAGESTTQNLENLDAALDKGDWDEIMEITNKIVKTDSPPDQSKRGLLGLVSGIRGTSKAAVTGIPEEEERDASSESGSGLLGAAARKDVYNASGLYSELASSGPASSSGEGIIGASPRKAEDEPDLAFLSVVTAASPPPQEKVKKKKLSKRNWISGLFVKRKKGDTSSDDGSVNAIQSSMEAIQKEFDPQLPVHHEDHTPSFSLATGVVEEVSLLSSRDRADDDDIEELGMMTEAGIWAKRQSTLVEEIERMAADLEAQIEVDRVPSFASEEENEATLEQLIDAKDWQGVDEFVKDMEVYNESELKAIKSRNEGLHNNEAILAQAKVKRELAAITRLERDTNVFPDY